LEQNRAVRHTEVMEVDPATPSTTTIETAALALRAGRLVAFPTETVYGLGAVLGDRAALRSVFEAKGRPPTDPLIVHLPAAEELGRVVAGDDARVAELARNFWPGPLTMVLPRDASVPDEATAGGPSVGVRVPSHPVAHALLGAVGEPVAAPSANRFGRISPTAAAHVLDELEGRIDVVLDGGRTTLGIESTVLDLTRSTPTVLRPGGVTVEQLRDVLGDVHDVARHVVDEADAATAPGQFLRHYAPSTPLVLVQGGPDVLGDLRDRLVSCGLAAEVVPLPAVAEDAARVLYRRLRRADGRAGVLLAAAVDPGGVGRAVNDRLYRAAHGRVVADASDPTVQRLVELLG
jgi:L-threonylcarbamoyladenylate synthase